MLVCEHLHCREWGKMLNILLSPADATQGFGESLALNLSALRTQIPRPCTTSLGVWRAEGAQKRGVVPFYWRLYVKEEGN